LSPAQTIPAAWLGAFPWPAAETHKHRRGALVVVSGGVSHTGAARLAARAGLRIGAGLVTVLCPPDALLVHAVNLEAVMVRCVRNADHLTERARGARAAVIGPAAGVGEATVARVRALRGAGCSLVLDADALTSFSERVSQLIGLLQADDVLTPHDGEFERLWPGLLSQGREAAAEHAARSTGAVIVLKGPRTLIAGPDGRMLEARNGSPWLATAGSGDVLAGMIGGLRAQGMAAFEAAAAAVWLHNEAGASFGPGLIAEDLPDLLPRRLAELAAMRP